MRKIKHNQKKGIMGEWLGLLYLLGRGLRPLRWRYQTPYGEVDWLCHHRHILVVVEIKFRLSWDFTPAIKDQQLRRLQRALSFAMKKHHYHTGRVDGLVLSLNHLPVYYQNL